MDYKQILKELENISPEELGFTNPEGEPIDPGIMPAVKILNAHGFKTFASCQGGPGHAYEGPTVRFEGNEFACIRAYKTCQLYNMIVLSAKRVYQEVGQHMLDDEINRRCIGDSWDEPFNEITFLKSSETGTIFRPD